MAITITTGHQRGKPAEHRFRTIVHQPEVLQQIAHQPVRRKELLLRHAPQPQTVCQKEHHPRPDHQHRITHQVPDQVLLRQPDQTILRVPDQVTHRVPDQ